MMPLFPMHMRGNDPFSALRLLYNDRQFLSRELLILRAIQLAQNASTGRHLDDFGILANVLPDSFTALTDAVGDRSSERHGYTGP